MFDRDRRIQTKTIAGHSKLIDINEEKEKRKTNNYSSIIKMLNSYLKKK